MHSLALDYVREAGRSRLAVWALAAFAMAFACDSALRYDALLRNIGDKRLELANWDRRPKQIGEASAAPASLSNDELAAARETARKLSMPWSVLFRALEASRTERVALLAIEPDAENRTVLLSAEAKDYAAALAYIGNLARQDALARVHLSHHELKQVSGQRVVAFTVSASWNPAR